MNMTLNEQKYNLTLSHYFSAQPLFFDADLQKKPHIRKCMELPFQQTKAKLWDEVTNTLCNLDFIQAKACAKMTYDLVKDFNDVLEVIPDNAENIRQEKARQARIEKYWQELINYTKGEISVLEFPECIISWTHTQIIEHINKIKCNPSNLDKLKDFLNFLLIETHNLQIYASNFPNFTYQLAWNHQKDGPVGKASEEKIKENESSILFLHSNDSRRTWNPLSQIVRYLKGQMSEINAAAISTDETKILSVSQDGTFLIWDNKTGKILYKDLDRLTNRHITIHPDGQTAINSGDIYFNISDIITGQRIKSDNIDFTLESYNSDTHRIIQPDKIVTTCFAPIGQIIFSGNRDGICSLWDLNTGFFLSYLKGHDSAVTCAAITPDGKRAISGSEDMNCIVWDLENKSILHTIKHKNQINSISITVDGKWAISGSYKICFLWNLDSGLCIRSFAHPDWVDSIAITPNGAIAITCSQKQCFHWNLETGQLIQILKGHTGFVKTVYIVPDGKFAISGAHDQKCIIWNLENGFANQELLGKKYGAHFISISPDGKEAYIASEFDTSISVLDLAKWKITSTFKTGHSLMLRGIELTPDMNRVITCSFDKTCIVTDIKSKKKLNILNGHSEPVMAISLTPDGKNLLSVSSNHTCVIWDINSGEKLRSFEGHSFPISDVDITPDGSMAVTCSFDATCILWNLNTGRKIRTFFGHTNYVLSICVSPDGRRALSSSFDNTCILWDLKTGQSIMNLKGHSEVVISISFTADGKMAFTAANDNTCILWDLQDGTEIMKYTADYSFHSVKSIPDGYLIGSEYGDIIRLFRPKVIRNEAAAITTIRKIWDFKNQIYQEYSANCPLCGYHLLPEDQYIQSILDILLEANLPIKGDFCLDLDHKYWSDPRLLCNCPNCDKDLRFNPFFGSEMSDTVTKLFLKNLENMDHKRFDEAEKSFAEENWEDAYNLYLKLVQQGKFNANHLRFNMALCRLNSLTSKNSEFINDINVLAKLLQEKGAEDKAQLIEDKLKERVDLIEKEELLRKKVEAPWWKKLF